MNGKVRIKTKAPKDIHAADTEILHASAWTDDAGHTFTEVVGTDKFTL